MPDTVIPWFEDEDLAGAPDLLEQLKKLEASEGWKVVSRILDQQAQYRLNTLVATPLKSLDGALEQEYMKGEAEQLLTLRGLPGVLIEELQVLVRKMREDAARRDDASAEQPRTDLHS
jgi:hypothetical protein